MNLTKPMLSRRVARLRRVVPLAVELEVDGHDASRRPAVHLEAGGAVARDVQELRVLENGDVEVRGLLGLMIEPEAG